MSTESIYDACASENELESGLVQCLGLKLEQQNESVLLGMDIFFIIFAAALLFFMQAGFAMVCAGCVRQKNVQNTMLKNLLDACSAAVGFWSFGYAFAYGGDTYGGPVTFIGTENFFLIGIEAFEKWIFQFAFAATSATIVAGTLAERCQMVAYLCYSLLLTGFVYPIIAHAIWSENGFLSPKLVNPLFGTGVIDFAGSGVVHVTGGITALIASKILGPRKDRFHDLDGLPFDKPHKLKGHSPSLQVLGTFIMWFGWFGFNAGSVGSISSLEKGRVAALAVVNTALSASSGCISALVVSTILTERRTGELTYDLSIALNGSLAGLVSVTAGCAVMEPWVTVIVGLISGLIYLSSSSLLVRFKIDDAVDAIPVHLFNGAWGVIAVGLVANPKYLKNAYGTNDHAGLFYTGDPRLLGVNFLGLVYICSTVFITMTPFFMLLSYTGYFRADPLEEVVGLDISYHGVTSTNNEQKGEIRPEILEYLQRRKGRNCVDIVE